MSALFRQDQVELVEDREDELDQLGRKPYGGFDLIRPASGFPVCLGAEHCVEESWDIFVGARFSQKVFIAGGVRGGKAVHFGCRRPPYLPEIQEVIVPSFERLAFTTFAMRQSGLENGETHMMAQPAITFEL